MKAMMDFDGWLSGVETDEHEDVYSLYTAVKQIEEHGAFKCTVRPTKSGNQYYVKCTYLDDGLLLNSDKARDYFLQRIKEKYVDDGMDIEGWYSFKIAMAKED